MESKQKYLIAGAVLVIAFAAWFLFMNKPAITNFEECVKAGYPVSGSYPRECKTPESASFPEDLSRGCVDSVQCPKGSFCGRGECTPFTPETGCSSDAGCTLIDKELLFSCCYSGACDPVDYSLAEWVAVNSSWFGAGQGAFCPTRKECGPQPLCPVRVVDDGFTASCRNGHCLKAAKGASSCQDLCGDGICQETACAAVGCPCTETVTLCPQDCDTTGTNDTGADCKTAGGCNVQPEEANKPARDIDYTCIEKSDCAIKDVGSRCGEYRLCVNRKYEPVPPELEISDCGYPPIDGCTCMNGKCMGTIEGKANIN